MTGERGREIQTQIIVLRDQLRGFAGFGSREQGRRIKKLLDLIKQTATRQTLERLVDTEFQSRLSVAASHAAEDPIVVNGEHLPHPWTNYTLVVLDSDGRVKGAVSQSPPNEEDKYKFALSKAVCALHLDKARMQKGLGSRKNLDYLASLGIEPLKDIFMGSAQAPVFIKGEKPFFLGAGGCELNQNYRAMLLGLDLEDRANLVVAYALRNTQAGEIDNAFCDEVAMRLADPNLLITPHEPKRLQRIRLRN